MTNRTTPTHAYIVFADGDLDQVCETYEDSRREQRDLREMGCTVTIHRVLWADQNAAITVLGSHA